MSNAAALWSHSSFPSAMDALTAVRRSYCDARWTFSRGKAPKAPIHLSHLAFSSFAVSTIGYGRQIAIEPRGGDDITMVIGVLEGNVEFEERGRSYQGGPGSVAVVSSLEQCRFRYDENARTFKFIFDRRRVDAFLHRMSGDPHQRAAFNLAMPEGYGGRLWAGFFDMFSHTRQAAQQIRPAADQQLEEMLLSALFETQEGGHSLSSQRSSGVAPRHVKRVVDHIRAHIDQAMTLSDLSRIGQCSIRSLNRGFQSAYQCSPGQFIRQERLALVRSDLENPKLGDYSITQIALSRGFRHLGEFSRHYKEAFGQRPNQTRRR